MKFQGSLACLLLALCLGSGGAGPVPSGGEAAAVGNSAGQGVGFKAAVDPAVGEAVYRGVEEAIHSLGNEAGRQTGELVRQGMGIAHNSWQGQPGGNGAWVSGLRVKIGGMAVD